LELINESIFGDDVEPGDRPFHPNRGPDDPLPDIPYVTPWIIPIGLALGGSLLTAASYIFMKCAHNRAASRGPTEIRRSTYCDFFFIFGYLLLLLGSIVNTVALGLGNQVLLASMGAITIILNCILSMFFLKERLILTDWLGIFIICVGSSLYAFQAVADKTKYDLEKLYKIYGRFESVAFLICSFIYIIGAYVMDYRLK